MPDDTIDKLAQRIDELGTKSTQILTFLSFVIIADVTLSATMTDAHKLPLMKAALWWWLWALVPIVIGVLPLKDLAFENIQWYRFIRWAKVVLLWGATVPIFIGLYQFAHAQ